MNGLVKSLFFGMVFFMLFFYLLEKLVQKYNYCGEGKYPFLISGTGLVCFAGEKWIKK